MLDFGAALVPRGQFRAERLVLALEPRAGFLQRRLQFALMAFGLPEPPLHLLPLQPVLRLFLLEQVRDLCQGGIRLGLPLLEIAPLLLQPPLPVPLAIGHLYPGCLQLGRGRLETLRSLLQFALGVVFLLEPPHPRLGLLHRRLESGLLFFGGLFLRLRQAQGRFPPGELEAALFLELPEAHLVGAQHRGQIFVLPEDHPFGSGVPVEGAGGMKGGQDRRGAAGIAPQGDGPEFHSRNRPVDTLPLQADGSAGPRADRGQELLHRFPLLRGDEVKEIFADDLVASVRPYSFVPGAVHRQEGAVGGDQRNPHGNGLHDEAQPFPLFFERLLFARQPAHPDGPFHGRQEPPGELFGSGDGVGGPGVEGRDRRGFIPRFRQRDDGDPRVVPHGVRDRLHRGRALPGTIDHNEVPRGVPGLRGSVRRPRERMDQQGGHIGKMPSEGLQFPRVQDPDAPGLVGGGWPARGRLQEGLVQHGSESRAFGNEEVDASAEQGLRGLVPGFRGEDHDDGRVPFALQSLGHEGGFRARDGAVDQERVEGAGDGHASAGLLDPRREVNRRSGGEGFEFPPERGFFARIAADIE